MPMFKLKSPDLYPAYILRAISDLELQLMMGKPEASVDIGPNWASKEDALREQRRFLAFKTHMRQHPLHRLHDTMEGMTIRCLIFTTPNGYRLNLRGRTKGKGLAEIKAALGL